MKNSRSVNLGVVIASVMLVASYVNAAEPDATKGKALSNVEAVKPAEALAKNKSTDTSPENKSTEYDLYHTVVEGENLSVLAKRFTGDANNWQAIAEANQLDDNGSVKAGQILRIPAVLNKVAIESVPSPEWTDKQLAGDNKPDAETPAKTVTVPASFKAEPPKELSE